MLWFANFLVSGFLAELTIGGKSIDLTMRLVIPQSAEDTMPMISYDLETSLTFVMLPQ